MSETWLVGGTPDATHRAVVAIVERRPQCSSPENLACTGTLIAPRAVLTSAHCLRDQHADELEVMVGASIDAPAEVVAVWEAVIHPQYDPLAPPESSHDLAVLVLASAPSVTPVRWSDVPAAEMIDGAQLTLVGYGATAEAPNAPSGERLITTATLAGSTELGFWTTGNNACGGDSGGAVFVTTARGEELVGVIKGSGTFCSNPTLAVGTVGAVDFLNDALACADDPIDLGRPPIEAAAAACTTACTVHGDCPLGMLCLPDGETSHCGWRDVRIGALGDVCNDATPQCVSVGQGAERSCRTFVACDAVPPADSGGCRSAGAADPAVAAVLLVAIAAAAMRRVHAAGRAPARTSSSRA